MAKSRAERVSLLSPEERAEILSGIDPDELLYDFSFWGRPEQFVPETSFIHVYSGGRGAGKSRAGAEFIRERALKYPGCRIALVGRTSGDTTSVMISGESGILNISPPSEAPQHFPSKRLLVWPNGSMAETYSAEEPDQLRGPQFNFAWADEFAAWKYVKDASGLNAWDNLRIGTRSLYHTSNGDEVDPQIIATTTPKRVPSLVELLKEAEDHPERITVSTGTTYDNAANLSAVNLETITGLYEGSDIGQQELMGLMLEAREGAIWTEEMIEDFRIYSAKTPRLPLRVVAVDPTVAESPKDECGIIVVGATDHPKLFQRHAYILEDATVKGSPEVWGAEVIRMAKKWKAPVVVETNQGRALVPLTLKGIDPTVRVYEVNASKNKRTRAEPIIPPYMQGRVHHWGIFGLLESQMVTWDPETSKKSPDRVDALVWGLYSLLVTPPKGMHRRKVSAHRTERELPRGIGTGLKW